MDANKVAVIGAGTMGTDVAVDLCLHNIPVILVDLSEPVLQEAKKKLIDNMRMLPLLQPGISVPALREIEEKVEFTKEMEKVGSCYFIVENVTENINVKKAVYRALSQYASENAIIGANTSCISITKLASFYKHPGNIAGMHLMNPVYLKDCAEVMRGYHTTEECLNKIIGFLGALDKKSIVVEDYPGFVSNRISHLYMNEAAFVVQDHVATADQVDELFCRCFGHASGPLQTADLIGLDVVVDSLNILYESYQDTKFRCCPLLIKMVDAGLLGKKSGQGFYKY